MSQDNKKSIVMYQGDGSNNVFSVPMTKGKFGTISVAFVRRGLDQYEYNPATFTLNSDNTLLTWTGATLNVGDFIVIQRTTTREQPFEFPNNQKHLEKSDDNLERQIQEVADKVDNALLVDPTHAIDSNKMTPLQWMATILRSVDSSVRGFKIVDSILYYSADDPNLPEGSKTWTAVLNTINVTTIREHNNYLEYSVDGGITWKNISAISVAFENITGSPEDNVALKNALDAKQDLIPDLDGIRSGAAKGAAAVQPNDNITVLNNNAGYITGISSSMVITALGYTPVNPTSLATVATTGQYSDLSGKPTIPTTLAGLTGDVSISNPTNGQSLQYDASLNKWKNVSSTASIGFDGITGSPEDNVALKNALDLKADVATTYTKTEVNTALSGKANTDMNNLTDTGKNIANWSSNVSNCITEIPQDINLTLSSGTLTLKAGSKVYFADGSSYTTTSDKTRSGGASGKIIIVYRKTSNDIVDMEVSQCYSGTTQPTGVTYAVWFDTTNNIVKWTNDGFANWQECSFPVALTTFTGGVPTSIDQVFNGFGYIGSTVFVLPGVKGLAPDGRNADGTLKNRVCSNSIVRVSNNLTSSRGYTCSIGTSGTIITFFDSKEYVQEDYPDGPDYRCWYRPSENKIYNTQTSAGTQIQSFSAVLFYIKTSGGKIASLTPKTAFHAVDYNDYASTAEQVNTNTTNIATLGTSKANTSLDNVSAGIDFVIETQEPTAENDYTWYRKYKSGWVEQGGISIAIADYETATITLPVAMANINYTLTFGNGWNGTNDDNTWIGAYCERLPNRTTTSFQLYSRGGTQRKISFVVSGKAA